MIPTNEYTEFKKWEADNDRADRSRSDFAYAAFREGMKDTASRVRDSHILGYLFMFVLGAITSAILTVYNQVSRH